MSGEWCGGAAESGGDAGLQGEDHAPEAVDLAALHDLEGLQASEGGVQAEDAVPGVEQHHHEVLSVCVLQEIVCRRGAARHNCQQQAVSTAALIDEQKVSLRKLNEALAD